MDKNNDRVCVVCGERTKIEEVRTTTGVQFFCKKCRNERGAYTNQDIKDDIMERIKSPKELVEALDLKVKGQDSAKKTMAVAVYNHYMRILGGDDIAKEGRVVKKNNVIMTGPTGTGKTYIAEALAEILGVPFTIASATSLSESGYVGNDVESILSSLWKSAGMNIPRTEVGIVFVDEVDKIARKGENPSITRDVSGDGVQKAMLKMMEGAVIGVPENGGRINPNQRLLEIDTRNILFICGGAFVGIESIVQKRLKIEDKSKTIGFGGYEKTAKTSEDIQKGLRTEIEAIDLEKFGMIPEFVGRVPIVCNLEHLTRANMIEILKSEHGIITEYKDMFKCMGKTLMVSRDAIEYIADEALDSGYGARGLRGIVAAAMEDIMYEAPSNEDRFYEINKETFEIAKSRKSELYVNCMNRIKESLQKFDEEVALKDIDVRKEINLVRNLTDRIYQKFEDEMYKEKVDGIGETLIDVVERTNNEIKITAEFIEEAVGL